MADETWYSSLDADTQTHLTGKGWDKLEPAAAAAEAVKAHYAAQRMIGVPPDQLIRMPKDAADPNYQSVYDRVAALSVPADPKGYTFENVKFADGTSLGDEDAEFVRGIAAKYKLPVHAAQGIAADLAARSEQAEASEAATRETTRSANNAFLRASYGADYDVKVFSATNAVEAAGLPKEVLEVISNLPAAQYKTAIDAFVALGQRMGEAALLRGAGAMPDPTRGMTADMALERVNALRDDRAWVQKYLAGDVAARDEFTKLNTIIAESRVPRR